jgi:hypothetical protein
VTQVSTAAAGSGKSLHQLYDYRRGPRQWAVCNATTSRDAPIAFGSGVELMMVAARR